MMKDIRGYEGQYAVTDDGKVWSYKSKRFLSLHTERKGYIRVSLSSCGEKKTYRVHRLVLETFKPIPDMKRLQVNHINENKADNRLENLEWVTAQENTNHSIHKLKHKRGKIKRIEQYSLDDEFIAVYPSQSEAARQLGINRHSISDCLRGLRITGGGYIWRYENEGE